LREKVWKGKVCFVFLGIRKKIYKKLSEKRGYNKRKGISK